MIFRRKGKGVRVKKEKAAWYQSDTWASPARSSSTSHDGCQFPPGAQGGAVMEGMSPVCIALPLWGDGG